MHKDNLQSKEDCLHIIYSFHYSPKITSYISCIQCFLAYSSIPFLPQMIYSVVHKTCPVFRVLAFSNVSYFLLFLGSLNCAAYMAGIIEAILCGGGFVSIYNFDPTRLSLDLWLRSQGSLI